MVVLALVSKGGSLVQDADAQVDITLSGTTTVDEARDQIISEATGSWQATRVAETSDSESQASVEFALPGSSLDGFISALRRQPDTESVEVSLEVDPEQLRPRSLADNQEPESAPEPVRVEVNLTSSTSQGPLVTFIGALLVAVLAAAALGLIWRRYGRDDELSAAADPGEVGEGRRWTHRP